MAIGTLVAFLVMKRDRTEEEIERILWIRPSLRGLGELNASHSSLSIIRSTHTWSCIHQRPVFSRSKHQHANILQICTCWCAPRGYLHPIHRDPLCHVTTVWLCGVWRCYISTYSFSSLSVFRLLLCSMKDMCSIQRMSEAAFVARRCGRISSMCTCTTGCLVGGCSWKGLVCLFVLQTNSPARQTGLSSQLSTLKQKKWKGENVRNA